MIGKEKINETFSKDNICGKFKEELSFDEAIDFMVDFIVNIQKQSEEK